MAKKTIEELHFELILDRGKFDTEIKKANEQARKLNESLSNYLNIKKDFGTLSAKEYQTLKRLDNLESNRRVNAEKELAAQAKRLAAEEKLSQIKEKNNQHQSTSNRLLGEAASLAASYVSIWGAKKLIENIIRTTGEFELQRTTLAAMLQDAEKATQIFEQLKTFSVKSPFSFKELATYAKQLTAYSVPINDLFNTTKMLADVSAGLGVGMDRLVLAYGQVRSAEFLRGQEVRQFTESGIPILEELRKQFVAMGEEGITVADVFDKISKRLVPFEMVDKVFKDLTSEGGKFFQMQEVQSETLKGKISNLKDAYMIMFNEIGSRQSGILKGGVDFFRGIAKNYEKVGRVLVGLVATYGTYKATLAVLTTIEAVHQATMVKGNFAIVKREALLASLTKQSKLFAAAQKLIAGINPWVAIGAAVAGLSAYFISAGIQASRFRKELEGIAQTKFTEAEKSAESFERLAEQLKNSTEGSQAYRDAIAQLNRQYGDYLPNLLTEKNALTEILKVENEVTNAIYARAKAYASEEGLKKIEDRYGKDIENYGEGIVKVLSAEGYGENAARDFIKGFRAALEDNPEKGGLIVFQEAFDKYFGDGSWDKISGTDYWQYQIGAIDDYAKAIRGLSEENKKFLDRIDTRFGVQGYSFNLERQITEPIVAAYNKALRELRKQKLPAEEFADKATTLELARLHQLKQAFEELNAEGAWTTKIKEIQTQIDALKPKDAGWLQKLVNPLVTGKGNNDLKAQVDTGYDEYLDKLRKGYKDVAEAYADSDKTYNKLTADKQKGIAADEDVLRKATEQNELYKQRKKVIEDIADALGVRDTLEGRASGDRSGGKSQAQKDIETRIDLLKKLQSAYEKLSEFVGDDKMGGVLGNIFSSSEVEGKDDIIKHLDYRKQIIDAAADLEKYDKDAAERLRIYIGNDEVSAQIDAYRELAKAQREAQDAQKSLVDYLKSWHIGDETEGSGSIYKVTKIVSDYQKALDSLNDKRDVATEKLDKWIDAENKAGRAVSDTTKAKKESEIQTKYETEATNLLNKATESVRKVAGDYLQEWAKVNNIDISNWSHKTIFELNRIQSTLENFDASNLPQEITNALKKAGIDIEKFKEAIKKAAGENSAHAEELANEKKWDYLLQSASALAGLFEQIGEYAETAGNSSLLSFANGFASSFRTMGDIAEKVAKQDYIGAIISGVTSVATAFLNAAKNAADLERNIRNGKLAAESLRTEIALSRGVESVFGTDELKSISNSWEVAAEKFKIASEDIAKAKKKLSGGTDNDSNGWGAAGGGLAGAGLGAGVGALLGGGVISWLTAPIGALIGGIVGVITGGIADIGLEMDNFSKSLVDMAKELNAPLINEKTGLFNIDTLDLILEKYDKLSKESRDTINAMIAHTRDYENALEQLSEGMKAIFDSVADDIASKFIEAFKASGDAALDYADILDDVAASLARMVIKSTLIQEVFKEPLVDDIANKIASGKIDEALAEVEGAMATAQTLAPYFQDFLKGIEQYMQPENGNDTLGNGIKGITENTANLLASYVNAIRADVASGKEQRDRITSILERQEGCYVTLTDYMMQVQANTANIAESNRRILERMEGFIRDFSIPSGYGDSLKVQIVN